MTESRQKQDAPTKAKRYGGAKKRRNVSAMTVSQKNSGVQYL